jgi:hypothetical protein
MNVQHKSAHPLARRIVTEYHEMPGLRLTLWQAARLWALDHEECERVLEALVDARQLKRSGSTYVRMEPAQR